MELFLTILLNLFIGGIIVGVIIFLLALSYKLLVRLLFEKHGYSVGIVVGIILFLSAFWWGMIFTIPKYYIVVFTSITFSWALYELSSHIKDEKKRNFWKNAMKIFVSIVIIASVIGIAEFQNYLNGIDTSVIESLAFALFVILLGLKNQELKKEKEKGTPPIN